MKENYSRQHPRRNILKLGLALAVVPLVGCGSENTPQNEPKKSEEIVIPQEILVLYPELESHKATSFDTIQTLLKTVHIVNFTGNKVDAATIQAMNKYLEEIAAKEKVSAYVRSQTQEIIPFQIRPNQKKTQNIFIVPDGTPHPSWEKFEGPAITIRPFDATKPYLTRITPPRANPQNPFFNTEAKILDALIAIETCQATIEVLGRTPEAADLMQEVYCNSIGNAIALKQQGQPYAQYLDFQKNSTLSTFKGDFNYLGFTQEEYSQVPTK